MYLPIVVALSLEKNDIPFDAYEKNKFFMCFNRGPKIHRCSLLIYMLKNKLLDAIDDNNLDIIIFLRISYYYIFQNFLNKLSNLTQQNHLLLKLIHLC